MDGFDRNSEQLLNTQKIPWIRSFRSREKGIKAPDNLSLNVKALAAALELEPSELLPKTLSAVDGTAVTEITLHWGNDESQSKLLYDSASQQYLMYRRSVPFLSAFSPQDRTVGVQLAFDCVIVQHANYQWPQTVVPVMTGIGTGSAHLYVNGQQYPCTWVKTAMDSPTQFLDANGNELPLPAGELYIAQFPSDHIFLLNPEKNSVSYQHTTESLR